MVLIIDNYDSFVYNIIHYLGLPESEFSVVRNDAFTLESLDNPQVRSIIVSPGPMTPRQAGLSCEVIRTFFRKKPILGICLGHECIGTVFGGRLRQCREIIHGQADSILLKPSRLYAGLPAVIQGGRYHSLCLDPQCFPGEELRVNASLADGTIMGVEHRSAPLYGVQFHPESLLTGANGKRILANFLALSHEFYAAKE